MSADLTKKVAEEAGIDEAAVFASAKVIGSMNDVVRVLEEGAKGFLPGEVQTGFMNQGRAQYAEFSFNVDDTFKNMHQNYTIWMFLNGERVREGQLTGRPGVIEISFRPIPKHYFELSIECVLA